MDAEKPLILIVDDRDDLLRFCERSLGGTYAFRRVGGARAAGEVLRDTPVAGVLLDRDFSQAPPGVLIGPPEQARDEGLAVLRWLRREYPRLPALMVTGFRDLETALRAADLGADFLAWEDVAADPGVLAARLRRALEANAGDQEVVLARFRELGLVVESPAFAHALNLLYRAVPGRAPILLLGETGSGKDTLGYAVHALGGDPSRPYVGVNVASLNPGLIESELFGHARGAFTGAERANVGKLRAAHGGTLFLNEVGDLAEELQAKLLTVLERSEVVPVGEVRSYPAEFRLVTATSRDLRALVETGRFRRDLYHRIAWHTVAVPPLRERREDIPALAHAFLRTTVAHREGTVLGIAREALEYLVALPWPGNVRELRGAIEAACAGARHLVTVSDLREVVRRHESLLAAEATVPGTAVAPATARPEDAVFGGRSYRDLTAVYYRWLVERAGGRLPEAARLAGISKATIYEWRERYGGGDRGGGAA